MIKKSQLQELVRSIVKETIDTMSSMTDPTAMGTALAATDVASAPTASAQAAAKAKAEREQRKASQMKLRALQKAQKLDTDKHKAEDKQFKIKKKAYGKQERDLKMSL